MNCSEDTVTFHNFVEIKRSFEFLASLDAEFDMIRVQVLGKETLPSLNEIFSIVRAGESDKWSC